MRRNKYRAIKTVVDGITFASKAEAKRYAELKLLERAGLIRYLTLQPAYKIRVNGVVVGKYVADFTYLGGPEKKATITEDVKGMKTALYRFKKKCVEAQYGITITEISPKRSRASLSKTQERKAA